MADGVDWLSDVAWLFDADDRWESDGSNSPKTRDLDGAEEAVEGGVYRCLDGSGSLDYSSEYTSLGGADGGNMSGPPAPPTGPPAQPRNKYTKDPRLTHLVKIGCIKVGSLVEFRMPSPQDPLVGTISSANNMIGIRCILPPAHATLESFFKDKYQRRNRMVSSSDPDVILESQGVAPIATEPADAAPGPDKLSMWMVSVTAFVEAAKQLNPRVSTVALPYNNPSFYIKQWSCGDDVTFQATLLRPPRMAELRTAFIKVTKWDRVEGKIGIDRHIGVGVERLNDTDLKAIHACIQSLQAAPKPVRMTQSERKMAEVTKKRTMQVAPQLEKLEEAVTSFRRASEEGVIVLYSIAPAVNEALKKVLGSGHLVDTQAPLVGDQVIRLLTELKWLRTNSIFSDATVNQITEMLFFHPFNVEDLIPKENFRKALRHCTEEVSLEDKKGVDVMNRVGSGALERLLKLCTTVLKNKRAREGGAAASSAGGLASEAPSEAKAPSKAPKRM